MPRSGNACAGEECSHDKGPGGAGRYILPVPTSFVKLYNSAMLAICYQQLFLS